MSFTTDDPKFNRDLTAAMEGIRVFRERAFREAWDPRAVRCALKLALKVDDYFARGKVDPPDEKAIEFLSDEYMRQMIARDSA